VLAIGQGEVDIVTCGRGHMPLVKGAPEAGESVWTVAPAIAERAEVPRISVCDVARQQARLGKR
jgi:hypothetical protein